MILDKKTFNRWTEWIEKIKSDLKTIVDRQQIFTYFAEVVNANREHISANQGMLFCNFILDCYVAQAAIGIRRHIKIDDDSISLMKLLEQIKKCAKQFTYDFYLEMYPINGYEWQKSKFRDLSKDAKVVSEEIIDSHMRQLQVIGCKVSNFVDRWIAHLDKRGYHEKPTYGDLEDSIDLFHKIACKYITLVTSSDSSSLKPPLSCDWKKIFSVPLDIRKLES